MYEKIEIYLVLLVLLFMSISNVKIKAQTLNLVPNPSFEDFNNYPSDFICGSIADATNWYNIDITAPCPTPPGGLYQRSSPDYFQQYGFNGLSVPNNHAGTQLGFGGGLAYAGFYSYAPNSTMQVNYREYIVYWNNFI